MLVTILEIVAFMVAAAVLGLLLGWVLRGMFGNEQAEISDVRAQLRKLKRAQRDQEAATAKDIAVKEEKAVSTKVVSTPSKPVKKPAGEKTKADTATKPVTEKSKAKTPQAKKKASVKKSSTKAAKKSTGPKKTAAEREADQAVARQAFAAVAERVGPSDAKDKLTKIYGVGKRYEEMLNELGLSSYAQLAKLRKAEVKTLSGALGVLDARLETEDWVGSAKTLAKETKK